MALPSTVSLTNVDSGTDDPALGRGDINNIGTALNSLIGVLGNLVELTAGEGLEDDGSGNLRLKLQALSGLQRGVTGLALKLNNLTSITSLDEANDYLPLWDASANGGAGANRRTTIQTLLNSVPAGVPTGAIMQWFTGSAPTGWLLCDGTSYATATHQALHDVIQYTAGGSGANFNVPDLRNRVPVGVGSSYGLNAFGGSTGRTVTFKLKDHTHKSVIDSNDATGGGGNIEVSSTYLFTESAGNVGGRDNEEYRLAGRIAGTPDTGKTSNADEADGASPTQVIDVRQPYRACHFIIKT